MYWPVKLFLSLIVLSILSSGVYFAWPYIPKGIAKKKDPGTDGTAAAIGSGTQTVKKPSPRVPTPTGKYDKKLQLARTLAHKDPVKARSIVENILKDPSLEEFSPAWQKVALTLAVANRRILFTDIPAPEKETYIVKKGDSLISIANAYNTTPDLIAKAHQINPEKPTIRTGQTLRLYKGYWSIKVSKANYFMAVYDSDRLVMAYNIAIGKQNRTPEGKFIISLKEKNPKWWQPGKVIPSGDPKNPLGTRWLALKGVEAATITKTGFGIHGTIEPQSIRTKASNGCIRMLNNEVEELYDILPRRNTPVILAP